jgi:hypothetical protein
MLVVTAESQSKGSLHQLLADASSDQVIDEGEASAIVSALERAGMSPTEMTALTRFIEAAGLPTRWAASELERPSDAHYINAAASDVFRDFIMRNLSQFPQLAAVPGQLVAVSQPGRASQARELFRMLDFRVAAQDGEVFVLQTPLGLEADAIRILLDHGEVILQAQEHRLDWVAPLS